MNASLSLPNTPHAGRREIVAAAICATVYLLFCLQQVVIGHGLGEGVSLGATALRIAGVGTAAYLAWLHGIPRPCRWPLVAIAACLGVLLASTLLSGHRLIAIKFGIRYATQLLTLWCVLNLVVLYPNLRAALGRAAVAVLWIGIVVGLGSRWAIWPLDAIALGFHSADVLKYLPRTSGLYEHPAIFGAVAVVVAVLITQLYEGGLVGRITRVAAYAGLGMVLILTEARNPLVPLLLLAAGYALWRRGRTRRIAAGLLIGLSVLVAILIWRRYDELTSASRESLLTMFSLGRTYIWAGAYDAWRENFWFGLGPGVFQFLTPDYTGGRFLRGELHAHNILLGILSETGVTGLLAFVGLIAALVVPVLRRGTHPAAWRWAGIWLVVVLGLGMFDFYLPFYSFSLPLSFAAALLVALYSGFDKSSIAPQGGSEAS